MFVVKLDKAGGFIGRDALMRQMERGRERALVQFQLKDSEPLLYHNEPIWRDQSIVGYITSGMYGHTLGAAVGLGYVSAPTGSSAEDILSSTYDIEVAGKRIPAIASFRPLYDPGNAKIRA
jgi:4-methylaminobutanoate oxidase (formaldehyde-forming)